MQVAEEPANEGQKAYLRTFGYFSEKMIKGLGNLQAAYLIDQAESIKEEGSASLDSQLRTRRKSGRGRLIVLLAVLVLVTAVAGYLSKREKDETAIHPEPNGGEFAPGDPHSGKEGNVIKKAKPGTQADPIPEEVPAPDAKPLELAVIEFPATVVTTEEIKLLNSEGKETAIAADTPIKIAKRSELGTLTMDIGGELFVGNESRLLGKVRLE